MFIAGSFFKIANEEQGNEGIPSRERVTCSNNKSTQKIKTKPVNG
jgi:hypothetical protein